MTPRNTISTADRTRGAWGECWAGCKCTFAQSMVGDGCDVCNPAKALELARARITELEARCAKYKAIIDRAPHHESCGFWVGMFKKHCDCWKKAPEPKEGGMVEFYSDFVRPGLTIPSSRQANANPVVLVEIEVFEVRAGERLKVEGFAQVDAVSDLIGTNVQIAYTDSNGPNFSGRWTLPSIHFWGTGNVWRTKGEHHKAHRPAGNYIATQNHAMVTFTLFANIYSTSPTPLYATINDAGMTIERYGI